MALVERISIDGIMPTAVLVGRATAMLDLEVISLGDATSHM